MKINAIEYYLPEIVVTNEQLSKEFPEWSAEKISAKIGINERHIASQEETSLNLAVNVCMKMFKYVDKSTVDFVLLCTQSPDYFLPTTACVLQKELGLRKDIGALDYNLGCSGYIYGLALAKSLIISKIASNVLLVTSETYSKYIHPKDKSNRSIFGDAATATLISDEGKQNIHEFELGTDGNGMNNLIVPNGGCRSKYNPDETDRYNESGNILNNNFLFMDGPEIFNFTISIVPDLIRRTLLKNSMSLESIDFFIFHQANKYMIEYLFKKLGILAEKYYLNIEKTGNTVSSTIPIALKNCIDEGTVKKGDKVVLAGFGVGYSWGATIITI